MFSPKDMSQHKTDYAVKEILRQKRGSNEVSDKKDARKLLRDNILSFKVANVKRPKDDFSQSRFFPGDKVLVDDLNFSFHNTKMRRKSHIKRKTGKVLEVSAVKNYENGPSYYKLKNLDGKEINGQFLAKHLVLAVPKKKSKGNEPTTSFQPQSQPSQLPQWKSSRRNIQKPLRFRD